MSGVPVSIMIVLIVGVVILRWIRPPAATSRSRIWLPIAAFVCGPVLTMACFLADVFIFSRDYVTVSDYTNMLFAMLVIGVIGGTVGAAGLWIGDRLPFRRNR